MSQTLSTFPALSSPIKVTDATALMADLSAIANLDNRMTIAFSVISLIHELNSKGGTDYRANHKQLRIDAQTLLGPLAIVGDVFLGRLDKVRAVIEWNTAFGLDAALTKDVNAIVKEMAGMRETNQADLMRFYYFLRYKLSLLGI